MNKFSLLLVGLLASGSAMAELEFEVSGSLKVGDCPGLITEDVKINLSNGVKGGAACAGTAVALATCSSTGRTAERSVEKFDCQDVAGPNDADGIPTTVEECNSFDPKQYEAAVTGNVFYTASSAQGTVVAKYPGSACTGANAATAADARI